MINVACLSYNDIFIKNFNSNNIKIDYFNNIKLINTTSYNVFIIIYDRYNIDIFKCIERLRIKSKKPIFILYSINDKEIIEELYQSDVSDVMRLDIDLVYLEHKIIKESKISYSEYFSFKSLEIDYKLQLINYDVTSTYLTNIETKILIELTNSLNKPISKQNLIKQVWGYETDDYRNLETHIKTIRKKLGPYKMYLITVWGYGYAFVENIPNITKKEPV